ncbi:MAG: hypothetical protein V6Z89_20355 [Desulfobacter sp.]
MKSCYRYKLVLIACLGILSSALVSGCVLDNLTPKPQEKASPVSAQKPREEPKKPTALYLDFEDVLVPMALSVVKDRTVIVSTPGFRSGILTLKGMVDSDSLFNFFSNNMEKDNWQVLSKIKSPGTTIMVFQKTAKCAVITIRDGQINTYVEVGVAPTLGGGTMGKGTSLTY